MSIISRLESRLEACGDLPWRVQFGGIIRSTLNLELVQDLYSNQEAGFVSPADAALVVEAVNAAPAMVKALKAVKERCSTVAGFEYDLSDRRVVNEERDAILALIEELFQ